MAYSTKEQVADEFVNVTFTSTTKVTDAQVDRWISEADEIIDANVSLRYLTPITGAKSLIIARSISVAMVAHRVSCKLQVKTPNKDPNQGGKTPDRKEFAVKLLDRIQKGFMDLPDADLKGSNDGVRSFNADTGQEQFFKRNVEQW